MIFFLGLIVGGIYQGMATNTFLFRAQNAPHCLPFKCIDPWFNLKFTVSTLSGIGNDATKALFNFGFCFTVTIAFMYIPLMPVLLQFPLEVQLLKREHFNRWFRIGPYYLAMTAAKLPMQIFLAFAYITMIYIMSDQPQEYTRMAMFYSIAVLIALTSESLGVLISSRLSLIVSALFQSFLVLFANRMRLPLFFH